MYCTKCGKQLEDGWESCPYCGALVGDDEQEMNNNTPLPKEQSKSMPVYRKGWFWLVIVLVVVGIAVVGFLLSTSKDKKEDQTASVTEQVKDFSDQDFKDLIGKSAEDLQNAGLNKSEDADEHTGLDGNLKIVLKEGKVDQIHIAGDPDVTPAFAGVRIGAGEKEAKKALLAIYPEDTSAEEMIKVSNLDTKESVECDLNDGVVSTIRYFIMTDEEVSDAKSKFQEVYIFPDSDEKYLSEDEIRSVSVDDMALGRNEIFARHGYIFNEEPFKSYFASQSWYEGTVPSDQFNADQVFNDFEKKNVELIKQIEDEINGVGNAGAFMGLDGWYTCTTASGGVTGQIYVETGTDGVAYFTFMTLENSYVLWETQGTVLDNQTIQINYYDCTITFTWTDIDNMYVTREGEFSGMDAGVMMDITDYQSYVRSAEFN